MHSFLYSAKSPSGQSVTDRIPALSVAEAKALLEQKGYTEISFHTDALAEKQLATLQPQMADNLAEVSPEMEKEGRQLGGFWSVIWYGIKLEWRWWAILAIWNTATFYKGPPFGLWAWIGFIASILYLLMFAFFRLPVIAFDNLLHAAVWHRGNGVRRWVKVLRLFRRCTGMGVPDMELDARLAVVMAREGDLPGAIRFFAKHENDPLGRAYYLCRQADLYSATRDYRGELETRLKALQEPGADQNFRLDCALILVRRMRDADAAESILKDIPETSLVDIARAFYSWVQGLIALERKQFQAAEAYLRASLKHNEPYANNPLFQGMRAEVKAFLSIALGQQGRVPEAQKLFRECLPLLTARKETELLDRCRSAVRVA